MRVGSRSGIAGDRDHQARYQVPDAETLPDDNAVMAHDLLQTLGFWSIHDLPICNLYQCLLLDLFAANSFTAKPLCGYCHTKGNGN